MWKKFDSEVFLAKGEGEFALVRATAAMNEWRQATPSLRIINIETLRELRSVAGEMRLSTEGLRVWFERE